MHLTPVPNYDTDAVDDGDDLETYGEVTDTSITFTGAVAKLSFHPKTGALQILLTLDSRSTITNIDLARLRARLLDVTIEPRTMKGQRSDPRVDPVQMAVLSNRLDRAMDRWVAKGNAPWEDLTGDAFGDGDEGWDDELVDRWDDG